MSNRAVLISIIILGLILRILLLFYSGEFWIDEVLTYETARLSIPDMLARVQNFSQVEATDTRIQTLPYHLLLHYWMRLGRDEFTLRLLSTVFGVLSLFVMWRLANELLGKENAALSLFLFAISPVHIYYSVECRAYAFFLFIAIFSLYYFLKVIKYSKFYPLYAITTLLCIYTHYYGIFLIIIENIVVIWSLANKKIVSLKKWIITQGLIILMFLPWAGVFFSQFANRFPSVKSLFLPPLTILTLHKKINFILSAFASVNSLNTGVINRIYVLIFFGFIFLVGIYALKRTKGILSGLAVFFLLPLLTQSFITTKGGVERYFIFMLPLSCIAISEGVLFLQKIKYFGKLISILAFAGIVWFYGDALRVYIDARMNTDRLIGRRDIYGYIERSNLKNSVIIMDRGKCVPILKYHSKYKIECIGLKSSAKQQLDGVAKESIDEYVDILSDQYEYFWLVRTRKCDLLEEDNVENYLFKIKSELFADILVELYRSKKWDGSGRVYADLAEKSSIAVEGFPARIPAGGDLTKEINILSSGYYNFYFLADSSDVKPFFSNAAFFIDGNMIERKSIGSSFTYIYKFRLFLEEGRHDITILFEKDKYKGVPGRRLFIKAIFFKKT